MNRLRLLWVRLVDLFGCPHEARTMPRMHENGSFYQTCLLCGRELDSKWHFEVVDYPTPQRPLERLSAIEKERLKMEIRGSAQFSKRLEE